VIPCLEAWGGRPRFSTHDPQRVEAIDIPFSGNPAELLAWDDAFLGETEETGRGFLWFWESASVFVVVGYGQRIEETVEVERCIENDIPILRRRSGGGTVVQGPGCLTYGITLPITANAALARLDSTNRWMMETLACALREPTGLPVDIDGHTDLTLHMPDGRRKFSGNAQRRTRTAVLFHGTVLHEANLQQIDRILRLPEDHPAYRGSRSHIDFLTLLPLQPSEIRKAIIEAWAAIPSTGPVPRARHADAMAVRYGHARWHLERAEYRQIQAPRTSWATR